MICLILVGVPVLGLQAYKGDGGEIASYIILIPIPIPHQSSAGLSCLTLSVLLSASLV